MRHDLFSLHKTLRKDFHKDDIMVLNYYDNDKSNGGSD